MPPCRRALLLLPVALFALIAHAEPPDFSRLSPARSPVVARDHGLAVATIFVAPHSAQLMVYRGDKEEARSPVFEFTMASNYGAAWVEQVKVLSPSRFLVAMRTRQTCGPEVYNYFFARMKGHWVLTRLDREQSQCSDAGIVPALNTTYDYIAGTAKSTKFNSGAPEKAVVHRRRFEVTPLTEFNALDEKYEGDP